MNTNINELFLQKCKEMDISEAKNLLTSGADIHFKEDEALCFALKNAHEKVVRFLINNGANTTARDNASLFIAIHSSSLDIVKTLIAHGADITQDNYDFVVLSSKFNRLDVVEFILNTTSIPQKIKFATLVSAIQAEDFEIISYLLEHEPTLPTKDEEQISLIVATITENAAIINLLLSYGYHIPTAMNVLQKGVMLLLNEHNSLNEIHSLKHKRKALIIFKKMKVFFENNPKELFLPLNFFDKEDNYKYNALITNLCEAAKNLEKITINNKSKKQQIESLSKAIEGSLLFFISKKYFAGYHVPIQKGQSRFVNDLIVNNQLIFQKNTTTEKNLANETIAKVNALVATPTTAEA